MSSRSSLVGQPGPAASVCRHHDRATAINFTHNSTGTLRITAGRPSGIGNALPRADSAVGWLTEPLPSHDRYYRFRMREHEFPYAPIRSDLTIRRWSQVTHQVSRQQP
jgi:hypothetical protein